MFLPRRITVVRLTVSLAVLWGVTALPADARVPHFGHVFLVIGENTSYEQITPEHALRHARQAAPVRRLPRAGSPKIQASPAFGSDGAIVITWDEGADPPHKPGHVLTAVLGPQVRPGSVDGRRHDHYRLERTLAIGFGVAPLAHARTAPAITSIWR